MATSPSGAATAEHPVARNIRTIVELEQRALERATPGERAGAAIADAIGTMTFVVAQSLAMAAWIGWNVFAPEARRFDPYPFGLMTFIVSLEGVLIATFVLLAQNRIGRQNDQRNHLSLQVSLLAEEEMTVVLRLLRRIAHDVGVPPDAGEAAGADELAERTDLVGLAQTIEAQLDDRA